MSKLGSTKSRTTARACVSPSKAIARTLLLVLTAELATLVSIACSGSPSAGGPPGGNPPPTTYTIGGNVSGLTGAGLVLQDNDGNNLSVTASGNFAFSIALDSGAVYSVTILTQPSGQNCSVTNASGTAAANVTTVQVTCSNSVQTTYTVGGSVSGLSGSGLVLQNDGGDNLAISASGVFNFSSPVGSGQAYSVTVHTQPSNPAQNCAVSNGSGTANANVSNVQVACTTVTTNQWTWVDGSDLGNQPGAYGTLGMPAPGNTPGARDSGVTWRDSSGNFWLFGGFGLDSTGMGELLVLNDLWKYNAGEWTWMSGSDIGDQSGVYGTQGVASAGNFPGSRKGPARWMDATGNLWLFGGLNPVTGPEGGEYNDLWEFSGGEWTWVSGANSPNQQGTYGTQGVTASTNAPGGRVSAVSWTDAAGNFWLFGGDGLDSVDNFGVLNDLWKYSAGQWTWMSGANTVAQLGTYGTQGIASGANLPGARRLAVSWSDSTGSLWLFGGEGYASNGAYGELNDLWKYSAPEWTWVNGSNLANQSPNYGTLGVSASSNVPGARDSALSLVDAAGNFWLFGGEGYDSTASYGQLNDLWKFSAGEWTWVNGANVANQPPTYGTEGTPAPDNVPGARIGAMGWSDAAGNLWIFGGAGYATGSSGELNDLWKDNP
jgi:hypothetical protein